MSLYTLWMYYEYNGILLITYVARVTNVMYFCRTFMIKDVKGYKTVAFDRYYQNDINSILGSGDIRL